MLPFAPKPSAYAGRLYIDQAQSPAHPSARLDAATVRSAHGRGGFVLMAFWPADTRDRYLRGDLAATPERTLTDPAAIRARLDEIRTQGHVWTDGEWVDGITAVAAPVLTTDGELITALTVFGPSFRFPGRRDRRALGDELRATAERLGLMVRRVTPA